VEYFTPKTIEEACQLLLRYKGEAKIIAGGTDLVVHMKRKKVLTKHIINIKDAVQNYVIYSEIEGLRIGARATIHSIESTPVIKEKFTLLYDAAAQLGSAQIRNRGTIAGNLCNASPSAEIAPPLIALGAMIRIIGADGERTIPIEDFFTGPGQTILKADEILAEIKVPNLPARSGGAYIKHSVRKAMDLAIVGVAAVITLDRDIIKDVKVVLGAVAPTPIRVKRAEEVLKGRRISDELLQRTGQTASQCCLPISDVRGSADYRRKMVKILVVRAIQQAIEQINMG
jgi:carbon-monoxide dehydrogenase medium subunit